MQFCVASYVVRECSYFPVHSKHSVHRVRYALCGPQPKADNLTTILCRCHEIWESQLPGTGLLYLYLDKGSVRRYGTENAGLWEGRAMIWDEAVVADSRKYGRFYLEGVLKGAINLPELQSNPVDIWTSRLQNANIAGYPLRPRPGLRYFWPTTNFSFGALITHKRALKMQSNVRMYLYNVVIVRKGKVRIHVMKACKGNRGITPLVDDFGARWRREAVSGFSHFLPRNKSGTQWPGSWLVGIS